MPGPDWVDSFMKRHKDAVVARFARNISHARASIDESVIKDFFENIKKELEGVPSSNIWNFNESNLLNDPDTKKVLVKRGTKYPERIRNATKACTCLLYTSRCV